MIRHLVNRMIAGAVAAGAALVAVVALGATVFYALSLVLPPMGAAAITAGLFSVFALIAFLVFANKVGDEDDDDDYEAQEPDGLPGRLLHLVQQRPVIGIVAALAAGAVLLKKPGLAALALTVFNDQGREPPRDKRRSRRR
ncbi:hypothetical protein [Brevundimonas sp.]|uniref:hypothetical protein n=1 Tax=Brevundimonas sp. TaxID=1871086 RepID=UPI002FC73F83